MIDSTLPENFIQAEWYKDLQVSFLKIISSEVKFSFNVQYSVQLFVLVII